MCSIEEAWAGQNFEGKPVVSQGDIRKAYMSLPDNLLSRNNEFAISSKEPNNRDLTRGINSKYSREPRVPNRSVNSNNGTANINFSSTMPTGNNYSGVEPRPAYMEIYDRNAPSPVMSKDHFSDVDSAFNVSNTVDNFMKSGMNMNINMNSDMNNDMNSTTNPLLNEDTPEDEIVFNNKISNRNMNQNKSQFNDVKPNNIYNSSDSFADTQVLVMLQQILSKLDRLEGNLHHQQSRNMYDIILYILIGMLLSFILYSIYCSMSKMK
uniref:Uncharacterized protein n=1 Tax=viral metagenome TaxID=1070528 RepID=A0A6C0F0K8_9ZZZZ